MDYSEYKDTKSILLHHNSDLFIFSFLSKSGKVIATKYCTWNGMSKNYQPCDGQDLTCMYDFSMKIELLWRKIVVNIMSRNHVRFLKMCTHIMQDLIACQVCVHWD